MLRKFMNLINKINSNEKKLNNIKQFYYKKYK